MTRRKAPFGVLGAALLLGLASSCLYDAGERCGPHQTFDSNTYACVCDADAPAMNGACVPCAADDTRAACKKGPTGFGTACASDADCMGFEASHCETLQAHVCVVAGCTKSPDTCQGGQSCCDLNGLGIPLTLCLPPGQCPAN
jgi:hypothetical protein